jgi:hypothetical protein
LTASVTVRDDSGLEATDTELVTVSEASPTGLVTAPRNGSSVSGDRVSLTATVLPDGVSKSVQFEYRVDAADPNPNAWTVAGSALSGTGTQFGTTLDTTTITPGTVIDVRVLVNGLTGSSENAVTVTVLATGGSIDGTTSSGDVVHAQVVDRDETTVIRLDDGTSVRIPAGSSLSSTDPTITVTVQASNTNATNGSAAALTRLDPVVDISVTAGSSTEFALPLRISLAYADTDQDGVVDGTSIAESTLEIHYWDSTNSVWKQDRDSVVLPGENRVVVEVSHLTEFAVFGTAGSSVVGGSSSGSSRCVAESSRCEGWLLMGLAVCLLLVRRRT